MEYANLYIFTSVGTILYIRAEITLNMHFGRRFQGQGVKMWVYLLYVLLGQQQLPRQRSWPPGKLSPGSPVADSWRRKAEEGFRGDGEGGEGMRMGEVRWVWVVVVVVMISREKPCMSA